MARGRSEKRQEIRGEETHEDLNDHERLRQESHAEQVGAPHRALKTRPIRLTLIHDFLEIGADLPPPPLPDRPIGRPSRTDRPAGWLTTSVRGNDLCTGGYAGGAKIGYVNFGDSLIFNFIFADS